MPLPTSTAAGGGRRCLLLRAVPVGYHRYPTTRSTAASVHGYPCSAYFVEDVLQAALPGKKTYSMGNLSMEKKNPVQKKSDLKKWTEESQMRVAGLFRGCGGRGCRGKLYLLGTGDLAGAAAGPVPGQALSPGH
ncbi:uncharacterized protein [Triticum aestivum]|uniref:uncharacterized protein isoform X4 n=1 Tax=Triticum aestivum TaxID=4565 RepID=UPI001D02132F|nr:uncharacterized protein LOC123161382 isoform X4 [Triticum aestivum]